MPATLDTTDPRAPRLFATSLASIASRLAPPQPRVSVHLPPRSGSPPESEVYLPSFVRHLIHTTFEALVDASTQQIEAYAQLLKRVATAVDKVATNEISDHQAKADFTGEYRSCALLG